VPSAHSHAGCATLPTTPASLPTRTETARAKAPTPIDERRKVRHAPCWCRCYAQLFPHRRQVVINNPVSRRLSMKLRDQIDAHRYLYLTAIAEPEDNALLLRIEEARSESPAEDLTINGTTISGLRNIESTESCSSYEIRFDWYVSYAVRNEAFTSIDEYERHDGRLFCIYTRSRFLDFVKSSTFASDDYPGKFTHYGFNCLNHIVDVASCDPPSITMVRGG
jgi:hypothetical protein